MLCQVLNSVSPRMALMLKMVIMTGYRYCTSCTSCMAGYISNMPWAAEEAVTMDTLPDTECLQDPANLCLPESVISGLLSGDTDTIAQALSLTIYYGFEGFRHVTIWHALVAIKQAHKELSCVALSPPSLLLTYNRMCHSGASLRLRNRPSPLHRIKQTGSGRQRI